MKIQLKNLLFALALGLSMLLSCKKNEHIIDVKTEKPEVIIPPVTELPAKELLPLQFKSGQSTMIFKYKDDHSLSSIAYSSKTRTDLLYSTTGKLIGLQHFDGGQLVSTTELTTDKNGLIILAEHILMEDDQYKPTGYYSLEYNALQQISTISYYDQFNKLINKQQRNYNPSGKLDNTSWSQPGMNVNFTYDDKNGIFKNLSIAWLFAIEKSDLLFNSGVNNITASTNLLDPDSDQTFRYTYNKDNYPETITSTIKGKASNIQVTYQIIP